MKKVKIMLIALAVTVTVGGAFAFRSSTFSGGNIYTDTNGDGKCETLNPNLQASTSGNFVTGTTTQNDDCVSIRAIAVD